MEGPSAVLNVMTLPPGATKTQARLVFDGVRGAIFEYKNGTPGSSLVGSWAQSAGTDPYGTSYPQGLNVTAGVIQGTNYILNSNGEFWYSGTPAAGNLVYSVVTNAALTTDQFGNGVMQGATQYLPGSPTYIVNIRSGQIGLFKSASPSATAFTSLGQFFADTSVHLDAAAIPLIIGADASAITFGNSAVVTTLLGAFASANGLTGGLPIVQTDTTTGVNANVIGAHALSNAWPINAGDMKAGTIYEIEMPWNAIMQSQTLQMGLSIDGSATFDTNDTIGGAIVGAGAGIRGWVKVAFEVLTTGVTGTYNATMEGAVRVSAGNALAGASNTGSPLVGGVIAGGTIDTTIAHNLRINSLWGASAAGQTVSGYGSKFTRSGP